MANQSGIGSIPVDFRLKEDFVGQAKSNTVQNRVFQMAFDVPDAWDTRKLGSRSDNEELTDVMALNQINSLLHQKAEEASAVS